GRLGRRRGRGRLLGRLGWDRHRLVVASGCQHGRRAGAGGDERTARQRRTHLPPPREAASSYAGAERGETGRARLCSFADQHDGRGALPLSFGGSAPLSSEPNGAYSPEIDTV